MKLTSLLNHKLIKINYEVNSKDEAISFLIDTISKEINLKHSKEEITNAILQRESLGGTVFETGIAMPHGRLDNFDDLVIAVLVPKSPIPVDTIQVRMFVLLLTSKTSSRTYLQTLSALAQFSQNQELFSKVSQIKGKPMLPDSDVHEFLNIIADVRVKSEILVEDIMSKQVMKLSPTTSLKEVTDLFYSKNISYAPVVDEKDNFIGEVTTIELLKAGIPNYASMIGNLKFLSNFEPFEELLRNEDTIQVQSVMTRPEPHLMVTPKTTIIEASLLLTQHKLRHLAVVENKKIIGVVSFMDVLRKILRG